MKKNKNNKFLGFLKKHKVGLIILLVLIILIVWGFHSCKKMANKMMEQVTETQKPQVMDLQQTITGSGTIEPNNQYSISPLVQGEIASAPFEEGDVVKKGQVLYQFDTDSANEGIDSAKISVREAEISYDDTVKTKADNKKKLQLKADKSGYVKKLYVSSGDTVAPGTKVADIYDNTYMKLEVPFNAADVRKSWIGKSAVVEVGDDGERLHGKVTNIAAVNTTMAGNMVVKFVTIEVKNPGGIAAGDTATASVNGVDCNSDGVFSVKSEGTLVAAETGTIAKLYIKEGSYVRKGNTYLTLKDATVSDGVEKAQLDLQNAQNSLDSAQKKLDDYSITAPIAGTVIKKSAKAGDSINANFQGALAVIYDLSKVKFQMKVDELDVLKVSVGQEVQVTADALENVRMTGHITNISLEADTSGGVTEYPVTVEMDDVGKLLPGMNVSAKIVIAEEKNALCIPALALQRGDYVYVKDPKQEGKKEKKNQVDSTQDMDPDVPFGFHKVSVQVGISNDSYVQILSGLSTEDEVYIPQADLTDAETMLYGGDESNDDEESDDTDDSGQETDGSMDGE